MLRILVGMDQKDSLQLFRGRARRRMRQWRGFTGFAGGRSSCCVPFLVGRPAGRCFLSVHSVLLLGLRARGRARRRQRWHVHGRFYW